MEHVFDFTLDRSHDGPLRFRKEYDQVLLADAYGGYTGVVTGNQITRAGCWAHLRRRFIDAGKIAREVETTAKPIFPERGEPAAHVAFTSGLICKQFYGNFAAGYSLCAFRRGATRYSR